MRDKFITLRGVMAPLPLANINTDSIIPSAWLRSANADFGRGLFGMRRYGADGAERPDFVLNRPPFRTARILLADENFGCGSSREAAVWALAGFGISCVLAPSFADIFYENAFRNGVLAGLIDPATLASLLAAIDKFAEGPVFEIDLRTRSVTGPDSAVYRFHVPDLRAEALMRGDDEIAATLRHEAAIDAFYAQARQSQGWLYPQAAPAP